MSRFDMFIRLFEPKYGWKNHEEAWAAYQAWEKEQSQ